MLDASEGYMRLCWEYESLLAKVMESESEAKPMMMMMR
jgi:hypothetical protein